MKKFVLFFVVSFLFLVSMASAQVQVTDDTVKSVQPKTDTLKSENTKVKYFNMLMQEVKPENLPYGAFYIKIEGIKATKHRKEHETL